MRINDVLRIAREKKIIPIIALSFIALFIYPLLGFSNNLNTLENNIAWLDVSRSSIIFIFDSVLLLFLIIVPLGALLLVAMKRRLKVIRGIAVAVLILMIINPITFIGMPIHANGEREPPLANKVFIITFDGTRADTFWQSANWIIQHKSEGVWAKRFVCTYPTITYPNHISLVTGTWPQVHGTESNAARYKSIQFMLRVFRKPQVQDIFDVAESYGITTAVFTPATALAGIIGGENTKRITNAENGHEVMQAVIRFMNNYKTDIESNGLLVWIHLVDPDETLHQYGVDSIQYRSAIRAMADQVGLLYDTIHDLKWEEDSVIIVTADHGAIGNRHYGVWPPLVADIPFWMWGKPLKKGLELGGGRIIDIAPTAAFILGIPPPASATGIVLYEAFNETYVNSVRNQNLDLNKLALSSLNKALWDEVLQIYLWGVITLAMSWIILLEILYLVKTFKLLSREERKLRKKDKE